MNGGGGYNGPLRSLKASIQRRLNIGMNEPNSAYCQLACWQELVKKNQLSLPIGRKQVARFFCSFVLLNFICGI